MNCYRKFIDPSQFQLRWDSRLKDDIVTICDDWDPPTQWSMAHEWKPQPFSARPAIPSQFLLHHWNHPHDALSFRLKQSIKGKVYHTTAYLRDHFKPLYTRVYQFWTPTILPVANNHGTMPGGASNENHHSQPFERPRASDTIERPCAIIGATPIKVIRQLKASAEDSPYGWGIYLEEGFAIPEAIRTIALFLLFCLILGVLVFCAKALLKYGFSVFGVWGATISLCSLIATLVLKYADSKS